MTNKSNFTSFAKRLQRLPERNMQTVLSYIQQHHDEHGSSSVFKKIKEHAETLQPMNRNNDPTTYPKVPVGRVPSNPRAAWYNVAHLPNGTKTVTVSKIVYTKKKNDPFWTPRYRNETRKKRSHRRSTRKHRR